MHLGVLHVQHQAAEPAAVGQHHALDRRVCICPVFGRDAVAAVSNIGAGVAVDAGHAGHQLEALSGHAFATVCQPFSLAVVQRQHLQALGLLQPKGLQLRQLFGVQRGQVMALREVGCQLVKFPTVLLEGQALGVARHGFPALLPDGPVTQHLEDLAGLARRRIGCAEGVGHAGAVHRHLGHAPVHGRRRYGQQFVQRGRDVDDVVVLRAYLTAGRNALGPMHDERGANAAAMVAALVPLQGCVRDLCPAGGVVVESVVTANVVDVGAGVGGSLFFIDQVAAGVDSACRTALGAGAVVRDQHHQRVVQLPHARQEVKDTADFCVGVGHEGGIGFLQPL